MSEVKLELGELAKPFTSLIEKLASAVGWIANRDTPKKMAEKAFIDEVSKMDISPLDKAALISNSRKIIREYRNQSDIVEKANLLLSKSAKPQNVDDDWLAQFIDKVRLVSDSDFQTMWAKILAGECNNPGSVGKGVLAIVERMDKEDAETFMNLARITVRVGKTPVPLVVSSDFSSLIKFNVSFDDCMQMEALGLVKIFFGTESNAPSINVNVVPYDHGTKVKYYRHTYKIPDNVKRVTVGHVCYTHAGQELYNILDTEESVAFWKEQVSPWLEGQIKDPANQRREEDID